MQYDDPFNLFIFINTWSRETATYFNKSGPVQSKPKQSIVNKYFLLAILSRVDECQWQTLCIYFLPLCSDRGNVW